MVWLVFCESTDVVGLWAFLGLKRRGLEPIHVILPEELTFGAHYSHRLSSTQAEVEIKLRDGRNILGSQVSGVLNRLLGIPSDFVDQVQESDRSYIREELHAFFMSWMFALSCPVLNPPSEFFLCGEWYDLSEWIWLARQAGLVSTPYKSSSRHEAKWVFDYGESFLPVKQNALVIGRRVIAPGAPEEIAQGCYRLSSIVGMPILGIDFTITPNGEWLFSGASPAPDLRLGGELALDALVMALSTHE